MDRDTLSALVLDHVVGVLRLALDALELVDVRPETALAQRLAFETACKDLEVSTAMLLSQAGVTWEAMAQQVGSTRQSMHRRLGKKSVKLQGVPVRTERHGLEAQWGGLITSLAEKVEELRRSGPRQTSQDITDQLLAHRPWRQHS